MTSYLVAIGLILAMLVGWVAVQQLARSYAAKHPEFGPVREEKGGCCGGECNTPCDDENTCPPGSKR
ncbi:MAG: hypothetical protein BWK79_00440 [Beggiatoa sp. IS2]|nr:MAG: hypothetical protein BWK79_00440 [Beggiatoa sp. IS2]